MKEKKTKRSENKRNSWEDETTTIKTDIDMERQNRLSER